jgi:hypothetical protein
MRTTMAELEHMPMKSMYSIVLASREMGRGVLFFPAFAAGTDPESSLLTLRVFSFFQEVPYGFPRTETSSQ